MTPTMMSGPAPDGDSTSSANDAPLVSPNPGDSPATATSTTATSLPPPSTTSILGYAEKIAEANRLKEQGNELFKANDFKKAARTYARVFAYTNGLIQSGSELAQYSSALLTDAQATEVNNIKRTTKTNLSMCHLRLGNYDRALECAQDALKISGNDVKASLRKAQALSGLKRHEEAREALVKAIKLEPNNGALRKELETVDKALAVAKAEKDAKMREMFSGKLL